MCCRIIELQETINRIVSTCYAAAALF